MIIEEIIENGERVLHFSDIGMKIKQIETGIVYENAIDVVPCRYNYEETNEPIEIEEENDG